MKEIVVQKFGGTSVATPEVRRHVVSHVERALAEGFAPVVVVSAMGRLGDPYATDTLLELVHSVGGTCDAREIDLLLACGEVIATVVLAQELRSRGLSAQALTGAQAGIHTDGNHGDARILTVDPSRVKAMVERGVVPVIAGFQGVGPGGEVTTLGRGGSDTSAAALAVSLRASLIEVFTDVDGVKTADPRLAPEAATLERLTFGEIVEMAHLGAKVIHPRAVEIAMQGQIPLKIRPTATDGPGTLVTGASAADRIEATDRPVTGIAHVTDRAQFVIALPANSDQDAARRIFTELGRASISADMIHVSPDRIAFIAAGNEARSIEGILRELGYSYKVEENLAKVSAVGAGMHGVPGVMARVAKCLGEAGVPILQTTDSHANISCLVPGERVRDAVQALHREFELTGRTPLERVRARGEGGVR